MKKTFLIALLLCYAMIPPLAQAYDEATFNALGRRYEPAPTGHVPGKDNGPGEGLHHRGEDCGRCHTMGGRAEAYLWTASGTLYADRSGGSVLKGGEIILEDGEGHVVSLTSNEAGNFWTTAPIASNPYTVVAHGTILDRLYVLDSNGSLLRPADPENPQTWLYKGWVKKGAAERRMLTIAPVAGASEMKMNMSCSMHHAGMGSRGGLWVSGASTLDAYPASGLGYRKHIYPILKSKCSPCHIPGATMTRLVTRSDIESPSTSIDHSGGLDLMTYEGSTVAGIAKVGIRAVVDVAHPEQSLLLRRTLTGGRHPGGAFWNERNADYRALRQWIAEGALKN